MKVILLRMKDQNFSIIRFLYFTFLTVFGSGLTPKAPGTFGSLATLPLICLFSYLNLSFTNVAIITFIIFIFACLIADYAQKKEKVMDPGWIVIDEVIGMLITWLFIFPSTSWINLFLIFGVFRFFDIIKIFPANWCDHNIKNGAGTIIDDVVSAIYAGIVVFLVNYFIPLNQ